MKSHRDLKVYQKAFNLAMEIFELSKKFPGEEKYALISQMRRSSRSVCSSIAEGYRKRLYPAHFVSKCSDADMENTETQVWFDFALACEYVAKEKYLDLVNKSDEVGRMLHHMINNPNDYLTQEEKKRLK